MHKAITGLAAIAAACALGACAKKAETESETAAAARAAPAPAETATIEGAMETVKDLAAIDPDAPPADGKERFYGREKFTIISQQTGAETGDLTEHVRDWGRRRAEVKNTTVNFGGYSQAMNTRMVQEGDSITSIDMTTGAVTSIQNPMYDTIVAKMKGKSGLEFGKEIMAEMGGRATGEKGSFAGHDCDYWEIAQMGAKTCITPWGGTLHTNVSLGGMTFERTATEVRMGDGGPDEAFQYDASKAVTMPAGMPDVSALIKSAQEKVDQQKKPD